jgi:hypothetical protein
MSNKYLRNCSSSIGKKNKQKSEFSVNTMTLISCMVVLRVMLAGAA